MALDQTLLIPFLFTFAIVLGALELSKVFRHGINVVLAISMGLFAVSYAPFLVLLNAYLPTAIWIFIVLFFIAFVLRIFGFKPGGIDLNPVETLVWSGAAFFLLLSVGWMFLQTARITQIPIFGDPSNLIFLLGLLFIIILFWKAFHGHSQTEAYKAAYEKQEKQLEKEKKQKGGE
ncbi:MAG TPA: hypothetical protein VJH90_02620 [archaeon]|nr:hypothetical protein [archaeon]